MSASERSRRRFYAALSEILPALPSLREALRLVSERAPTAGARRLAIAARSSVDSGLSLADGLLSAGSPPPPYEAAVIRAAEESGILAERLGEISRSLDEDARRRRALFGRLLYPAFLLHFAVLVGAFTSTARGGPGPIAGAIALLAIADASALLVARLLTLDTLAGPIERLVLGLPIAGRIAARADAARALAAVAALYGAGRPLASAARDAAAACRLRVHRESVESAAQRLAAGESAESTIAELPFLDPEVGVALALGAPAGRLEPALVAAAELSARRRDEGLVFLFRLFAGAAVAIAFATVAYTVLSFWSGIYSGLGRS